MRTAPTKVIAIVKEIITPSSVVAELERDAEVVLPQTPHGILEVVFRGRRHADLIALDAGLDLLEFLVLEKFHDLARRLNGNALLNSDDFAHRATGGRLRIADCEVLHRHIASHQTRLDDRPRTRSS